MTQKIRQEFERSPIQFLLNCIQLIVLLGGMLIIGDKIGAFRETVNGLKTSYTELHNTVIDGFASNSSDHENLKIRIAVMEHSERKN